MDGHIEAVAERHFVATGADNFTQAIRKAVKYRLKLIDNK
jgi:hypothetical protein